MEVEFYFRIIRRPITDPVANNALRWNMARVAVNLALLEAEVVHPRSGSLIRHSQEQTSDRFQSIMAGKRPHETNGRGLGYAAKYGWQRCPEFAARRRRR